VWSRDKGTKTKEANEMKSTIAILHHLAGEEVHLNLLGYFYKHKDRDAEIKHREIHKFFKGKSSSFVSHYVRAMVTFGLTIRVISPITEAELGYKISAQGIEFFEMYLKIEAYVA